MPRPGARHRFPGSAKFAFTVVDDTDVATVDNVKPIYDLLHQLGLRTTKTVWPLACPEGSADFASSQTLEDADYREFTLDLQRKGFELTWHGATMEASERARTVSALERFNEIYGSYPRIHLNHALNRENVYWGVNRLDSPLLRGIVRRFANWPADYFTGEVEGSPFWWGDLCSRYMKYGRNLTTNQINTARFNPSMPYRDPERPLVPYWFSSSDAESVEEFNELIHPRNQQRLESEGGFCIVATHFGKDFVRNGRVNPVTRARLEELAARPGWFPTAGELLDWLRERKGSESPHTLPRAEWTRMQWRFVVDLATRKLRSRGQGPEGHDWSRSEEPTVTELTTIDSFISA
jgi:hypothetical protein